MTSKDRRRRKRSGKGVVASGDVAGVSIVASTRGWHSSALVSIADARLREAGRLHTGKMMTGAAYISGYAVEILLKALIADRHFGKWFPLLRVPDQFKTHNLDVLLKHSGYSDQLRMAVENNRILGVNWTIAKQWKTELRYMNLKAREADDIFTAMASPDNGVAAWLRLWATGRAA